jgi:hypothetical protein
MRVRICDDEHQAARQRSLTGLRCIFGPFNRRGGDEPMTEYLHGNGQRWPNLAICHTVAIATLPLPVATTAGRRTIHLILSYLIL